MTKSHGLPVESPNWWPIADALEHRSQRRSSDKLAAQDFHQALRKPGRLRALEQRADGHRKPLAASTWEDLYIFVWAFGGPPRSRMPVFSRKLGSAPRGCRYFVWRPDYENIFGDKTEATKKSQQQPVEEQPKQGAPLKHDWIAITTEVAFREATATRKQRDKSDLAEARSVRRWCATRLKRRPALSDIREVVKAVRERFRQPD